MRRGLLTLLTVACAYLAHSQVVFNVQSPSIVAGNYDLTWSDDFASWGGPDLNDPVNSVLDTLMLVDDGTAADSLGCNALINDLTGKIAVVYRGDCQFGTKALNAQTAGAIAVVIINNVPGDPVGMNGGTDGLSVTIPVVMISQIDGSILRARLNAGEDIVVFIGSKNGLFPNDLAMREARTLLPNPITNHSLLTQNPDEYQFRVGTWIYNDGQNDQTNAGLRATITYGSTVLYNEVETGLLIPSGDSLYVEFNNPFTSTIYPSGAYNLHYEVLTGASDDYISDNLRDIAFNVSDLVWSYVGLNADGLPSAPTAYRTSTATSTFSTCIHFLNNHASRTKAEGLYFQATTNTSAVLNGQEFIINAYKWNNVFTDLNDANAAIDNLEEVGTGSYTYTQDSMDFLTVYAPFSAPFNLIDNQRYLFCVTTYDANTYIGYGNLDYSWVLDTVLQPLFPIQTDAGFNIVGFGGEPSAIGVKLSPVTPAPIITASGFTTICQGQNLVLTSSADNGNVWSNGAGTKSITVSSSGTYSVTVGGLVSNSITVDVVPYPAAPSVTASSNVLCAGGSVTLTSSDVNSVWSNGTSGSTTNISAAGTYSVIAENNGCQSAPASITITDVAVPSISATGNTTFCNGQNVILTSSSATGNLWSTGETSQSIQVSSSQTVSLDVNAMGCTTAASNPVTVTVNPGPDLTLGTITEPLGCGTLDGAIDLNGTNSGDLVWTGIDRIGAAISGSQTAITLPLTVSSLIAGSYTIVMTDANGCTTTINTQVNDPGAPASPAITTSTGTNSFCLGGTIDLTADVATDILWSTGETTQTITVSAAGNYSLNTGALTGCISSSMPIEIIVNNLPTVDAGADVAVCPGEMVSVMGSGAATYTWDNGISNGVDFAPSATTTYTVTGTDFNGCLNTDQVTVTVHALPSVSAGSDQSACLGTTVTLTASGADSYSWNNGVIDGQAFTAVTTTTYTVTGTDANGCVNMDDVVVTVNPLPNVTYVEATDTVFKCQGQMVVTLSAGSPALGVYSGSGVTTSGASAEFDASGLQPGYYVIVYTATDANGCQGSAASSIYVDPCIGLGELDEFAVSVYPNPAASEFLISSDKLLNFSTVELTDQMGRTVQTWKISNTAMTLNISNIASGNYNLVFKGTNGQAVERVQIAH